MTPPLRSIAVALALCCALSSLPAQAHDPSEASAASALSVAVPVAASVAAPVALMSGTVALTVVSVQVAAEGTVWVLERASDGARLVLRFTGNVAGAMSVVAGTAVSCTVLATGWLLSAAGEAIAFVPNQIGASLIYNEPITQ